MLTWPLLFAALAAGALGGVHCLGMCGALGQWLAQPGMRGARGAQGGARASGVAGVVGAAGAAGVVRTRGGAPAMRVIALVPEAALPSGAAVCATGCAAMAQNSVLALVWLHLGRISTYALIGAFVGASGGMGLLLRPFLPLHGVLLLAGNLALLYLAARLAGLRLGLPNWLWLSRLQQGLAAILPRPAQHHPFVNGLAWGCLPCGLLYTVLPFALLSGAAWSGSVLLALFGVGTLPYLLLAQSPVWAARLSRLGWLRKVAAGLLFGWGGYGLLLWVGWVPALAGSAALWCVPG
jgi:sulfite exporter TauE/SafE